MSSSWTEARKPIVIIGAILIIVFTVTDKRCLSELVVVLEAIAIFFAYWNVDGTPKHKS